MIDLKGEKYRILKSIGSGGSGIVYKVEHEGSFFALKLVESNQKKKNNRFLRECAFAFETDHERIVKYLDYGKFDKLNKDGKTVEVLYCLMPLYGSSLRKILDSKVNDEYKLKLCIQICEALSFIHSKGIVHRDIKPENILISNEGNALLADFGIAHFCDSILTDSSEKVANFTYRAPEQLGKKKNTGIYTDIYALGLILNEFFTGDIPQGINYRRIADINIYYNELDDIVGRMLIQDVNERLSDANIVKAEIDLIYNIAQERLMDIKENLLYAIQPSNIKTNDLDRILEIACHDILLAKYLFYRAPERLKSFDSNYNMIIGYKVSDFLLNLSIQECMLSKCTNKFEYESAVYRKIDNISDRFDGFKLEDRKLCNEMIDLVNQYPVDNSYDLSGMILKYFISCEVHHKKELLESCKEIHEECEKNLMDAPILWLFNHMRYYLKDSFDTMKRNSYEVEFDIEINWERTMQTYFHGQNFNLVDEYESKRQLDNLNTLTLLKIKYPQIVFDFNKEENSAKIFFPDFNSFESFKNESLLLAKPHYVFEGDVMDILRIKRQSKDCIELHLGFFDIENIIPKLLGLIEI